LNSLASLYHNITTPAAITTNRTFFPRRWVLEGQDTLSTTPTDHLNSNTIQKAPGAFRMQLTYTTSVKHRLSGA